MCVCVRFVRLRSQQCLPLCLHSWEVCACGNSSNPIRSGRVKYLQVKVFSDFVPDFNPLRTELKEAESHPGSRLLPSFCAVCWPVFYAHVDLPSWGNTWAHARRGSWSVTRSSSGWTCCMPPGPVTPTVPNPRSVD